MNELEIEILYSLIVLRRKEISGEHISAASDGVEALLSATKSDKVKSVSCPMAEITGMILVDEEGELTTREVKARFVNGNPSALEATYIWRSEADFERFMRFAKRYANSHGLGYTESSGENS